MDFIDKLKEGLDKGVKTVSVKSREVVDTLGVKNQLSNLREEKRSLLEELGRAAYAAYKEAPPADQAIAGTCERITALDLRIAEKERDLEAIHRKAEEALAQPPAAAAATGAPAGQTAVPACACGAPLREEAKFCSVCGKPTAPPYA